MRPTSIRRTAPAALFAALLALSQACGGAPTETSTPTSPDGSPGTPTEPAEPVVSIVIDASTVDFGAVDPGTSATRSLEVENTGNVAVTLLRYDITGSNGTWFRVSGLGILEPGATSSLTITFAPAGSGAATGVVTVTADPEAGGFVFNVKGSGSCTDDDGDSYCSIATGGEDCDDQDGDNHPGADEYCDDADNDCDGLFDEEPVDPEIYYRDGDGDGFGPTQSRTESCEPPQGRSWVEEGGDCDDANPAVNPDAAEVCDGIDNNCNNRTDEETDDDGDGTPDCTDDDGDGYCEGATCLEGAQTGDCDDDDSSASPDPAQTELPGDGVDNNCNGTVDENTPPLVSFLSPDLDDALYPPGTPFEVVVRATDAEDGAGVAVTLSSDLDGTLCEGVTDASFTLTCEVSLSFGRHVLTASAVDSELAGAQATRSVLMDTAPQVQILSPRSGDVIPYGTEKLFNATVTDPDDASEDLQPFTWESDVSGLLYSGTAEGGVAAARITLTDEGPHVLTLTVRDQFGAVTQATVDVTVGPPACSPTGNLVAQYHFDEGSAADSSGNGLDAQLSETATYVPGKFGDGVQFNGTDSFVSIANTDELLSLQKFTLETWVQLTTPAPLPTRQPLFNKLEAEGTTAENYDLRLSPTGTLQLQVERSSGPNPDVVVAGTTTFAKATWYLMTATFDGSNLRVYVNGAKDGELAAGSLTLRTGEAPLILGTDSFSSAAQPRWLNGVMDEVRILNCALTDAQIQAGYDRGTANPDP